jgi:hypothetical protein
VRTLPFGIDAAKEAMESEAVISYELYRICRNTIAADAQHQPIMEKIRSITPEGNFGEPQPDGRFRVSSETLWFKYIIPECRVSPKHIPDLLITVEEHGVFRPFILFECKRRPISRPGPSYAAAFYTQGMRYSHYLGMQYFAVYDGWVIILGTRSYPYLLGIFDAQIERTLTPNLIRDLLRAVRGLELSNHEYLESLKHAARPADPKLLSQQVLPSIARKIILSEKKGAPVQTEKGAIDSLVKHWREYVLLL